MYLSGSGDLAFGIASAEDAAGAPASRGGVLLAAGAFAEFGDGRMSGVVALDGGARAWTGHTQLDVPVQQLVREQDFRALLVSEPADEQGWITALAAHPEVMQRPVVVAGGQARLGRPPENVLDIL